MALNNLKEAQAYIESLEEIRDIAFKMLLDSKDLNNLQDKNLLIDNLLKSMVKIAGRNDAEMRYIATLIDPKG